MKAYVGFGELSYFHIILVVLPVLTISGPFWIRTQPNQAKYSSVYIILNFFSSFVLAYIIHLISILFNKAKEKITEAPLTNSMSRVLKRKKCSLRLLFMILILSFLDFIRFAGLILLGTDDSFLVAQIELRTTELIFMAILSKYLLDVRLFKHHIASIISIVIGVCFVLIYATEKLDLNLLYQTPLAIFFYFCLSLKCVCEKWLMDIRFVPFQRLLILEGLFSTIISLGLLGFQHLIYCPAEWKMCGPNNRFTNVFSDLVNLFTKENNLIYPVIVHMTVHSINNVLMMLINKYLSPCHRAVSDTIAYFIWLSILFLTFPSGLNVAFFTLFVLGYCIILIASLVYNEVLILYFCNLDYNVKIKIMERGNKSIISIERMNFLLEN